MEIASLALLQRTQKRTPDMGVSSGFLNSPTLPLCVPDCDSDMFVRVVRHSGCSQ